MSFSRYNLYDAGKFTMPSRDFLVRQSILNAAAELFPETVETGMLPRELRRYLTPYADWPAQSLLFQAVPDHFRALVESYGGTVCPSP